MGIIKKQFARLGYWTLWKGINHDPEALRQMTITALTENHINQQKTQFELDKK